MFPDAEERAKAKKLGIALPARGSASLAADEDEQEAGGEEGSATGGEGGKEEGEDSSPGVSRGLQDDSEVHKSLEKMDIKQEGRSRAVQEGRDARGKKAETVLV
eukprot:754925-Hanusia_phi.AAC.4